MSFAAPQFLGLLLIVLPIIAYVGYPRWHFRRRRDISSLTVRSLIASLLILALAGLQVVRDVERMAVVFLVDASDSMGTAIRDEQINYIEAALAQKPADDTWALVVFGAHVAIETPFNSVSDHPQIQSTVLGNQTDIADALQTAMSLFPADARRRIVILSDGIQTIGNAEAKARLAQASGVEISYVLLARERQSDVRISEFSAPAQVNEGQEFDIHLSIEADAVTRATLFLYAGDQLLDEADVSLRPGTNNFSLTQRSRHSGFLNFSAQIVVDGGGDTFLQNNQLGTFSQVLGQARVLLVYAEPSDIVNLLPALVSSDLVVEAVAISNMPRDLDDFAAYESVIIANVPASAMSETQMQRLQSYVRDLGGGLVFIGGPSSYGAGGYFQTPIEALLPVENRIRDQERLPRLTIAYLVDSSGSMGLSTDGIFSKLQLSQRAVALSIDFLQPQDRAAILTFEAQGALISPFQDVLDGRRLEADLSRLGAGGSTNILAGLSTAETYMRAETSERRHLILITDGGADDNDLLSTAERLYQEEGITLSIIAIGSNFPPFLAQMAQRGGGNYHEVRDAAQIPTILAQETVLASRSYIVEGEIGVQAVGNSPMLNNVSQVPPLQGYIATTARETAQVALQGADAFADPILVTWQYGLGRTVAFTSDATGRWGTNWVSWADFTRFWGQVVHYSITDNGNEGIETQVIMRDGVALIDVDVRTEEGSFYNNLLLQATVVDPTGEPQTVRLQQIAPGQYQGRLETQEEGAYYLAVHGGDDMRQFNALSGWVMAYSDEYIETRPDAVLLNTLADLTGGQDLAARPDATFVTSQIPRKATRPIWQWLVIAAMLLLPIDIAIRRLVISHEDWSRLRAWLGGDTTPTLAEERIGNLMAARNRARHKTGAGEQDFGDLATDERPSVPPTTIPGTTTLPHEPDTQENASTVSALLKRRRDQRDDDL